MNPSNPSTPSFIPQQMASAAKLLSKASPFCYTGSSSEDINLFLEDLNSFVTLHGLNVPQQKELFRLSLRGIAAIWLANQRRELELDSLINLFKQRFMPRNLKTSAISKLSNEKYEPGTSLLTFLDKIQRMAQQAELHEEILITLALKALPSNIQKRIFSYADDRIVTWDTIYEVAWANDDATEVENKIELPNRK